MCYKNISNKINFGKKLSVWCFMLVLLAAMARAVGIQSRCVGGMVYVSDLVGQKYVFGFHLWTPLHSAMGMSLSRRENTGHVLGTLASVGSLAAITGMGAI